MNNLFLKSILFFMMSSICSIDISSATIYVYMFIVLFVWILSLKYIRFNNMYIYEYIYILLYVYIIFSSLWSIDYGVSFKLIIGEMVLLLTYFILRYLVSLISLREFENQFLKLAKYFTIISLMFYLYGIFWYYILGYVPTDNMYLNDHSIGIYGLYFEGYMPRFRGLSESPNNYFYIEFLLAMFFLYKKRIVMFVIAIITLLLTLSSTGILVLFIVMFLGLFNKKSFVKVIFFSSIVSLIVVILFFENSDIHDLLNYRIERTATGSGRWELWEYLLSFINSNPLFGYGANTTRVLLENFRHLQSAHNSFMDIMITTGIIGLVLEMSLFAVLLHMSYALTKYFSTKMFINLWILYFIISLSNNTLHIVYTVFYLFFIYKYYDHMNNLKKGKYK